MSLIHAPGTSSLLALIAHRNVRHQSWDLSQKAQVLTTGCNKSSFDWLNTYLFKERLPIQIGNLHSHGVYEFLTPV